MKTLGIETQMRIAAYTSYETILERRDLTSECISYMKFHFFSKEFEFDICLFPYIIFEPKSYARISDSHFRLWMNINSSLCIIFRLESRTHISCPCFGFLGFWPRDSWQRKKRKRALKILLIGRNQGM